MSKVKRKIVTILAADVAGYSRLMGAAEGQTIQALKVRRKLFDEFVHKYEGREFGSVGDSMMAEFASAVNAVMCAVAIQKAVLAENRNLPAERQMALRIGLDLGDIVEEDGSLYGDGVNTAARIQSMAAPGGISVSGAVHQQVRQKLALDFKHEGSHKFKNITQPVSTYAIVEPGNRVGKTPSRSMIQKKSVAIITVVLIFVILGVAQFMDFPVVSDKSRDPLRSARRLENAADAVNSVPTRKTVAVLPFKNMSPAGGNAQMFSAGLHDDLITQISQIAGLITISRSSVIRYQTANEDFSAIVSELGVDAVIEGSVLKAGNRIRVNVQLVDADTEKSLWADSFDYELSAENIIEIQRKIAVQTADVLEATLSPTEIMRLSTIPTHSLSAYEAYLMGKQYLASRTSDGLDKAVSHFQKATSIDPEFPLAHVGLADSYFLQIYYSGKPSEEMLNKAELAVQTALKLDNQSSEAYSSLGAIRQDRRNFSGAEAAFKYALELNPNNAQARQWYGDLLLYFLGRADEAFVQYRKAVELDPLSAIINNDLGFSLVTVGKFQAAMESFEKVIDIDPDSAVGYANKGGIYWEVFGQLDKAHPWLMKSIALDPDDPSRMAWLVQYYLDLGAVAAAECWSNRSITVNAKSASSNFARGLIYTYRGEGREAAEAMQRAIRAAPTYWPEIAQALSILRDEDISHGRVGKARARYQRVVPALFNDNGAFIDRTNFRIAIDLALVLKLNDESELADKILEKVSTVIQTMPRLGVSGFWIADVRFRALRGETGDAIRVLNDAVRRGWRLFWWYYLERDPVVADLRHDAEYQQSVMRIKADIATQRGRVQKMEQDAVDCATTS